MVEEFDFDDFFSFFLSFILVLGENVDWTIPYVVIKAEESITPLFVFLCSHFK